VKERTGWAIALAIVLIQAILLGYGLTRASSPATPDTPISPSSPLEVPLDIEGVLPFASETASEWRQGARLARASLQIDWPRDVAAETSDLPTGGWIVLSFLSDDEMLTMRIDRGSGTIVETRVVDVPEDDLDTFANSVIDLSAASTRSGTAMRAAFEAYGREYRVMCPDRRFVSWLTVRRDPVSGSTYWTIEFEDHSEEEPAPLRLDVDWQTGDVLNVENAGAACS
jgi:hypothetical protein